MEQCSECRSSQLGKKESLDSSPQLISHLHNSSVSSSTNFLFEVTDFDSFHLYSDKTKNKTRSSTNIPNAEERRKYYSFHYSKGDCHTQGFSKHLQRRPGPKIPKNNSPYYIVDGIIQSNNNTIFSNEDGFEDKPGSGISANDTGRQGNIDNTERISSTEYALPGLPEKPQSLLEKLRQSREDGKGPQSLNEPSYDWAPLEDSEPKNENKSENPAQKNQNSGCEKSDNKGRQGKEIPAVSDILNSLKKIKDVENQIMLTKKQALRHDTQASDNDLQPITAAESFCQSTDAPIVDYKERRRLRQQAKIEEERRELLAMTESALKDRLGFQGKCLQNDSSQVGEILFCGTTKAMFDPKTPVGNSNLRTSSAVVPTQKQEAKRELSIDKEITDVKNKPKELIEVSKVEEINCADVRNESDIDQSLKKKIEDNKLNINEIVTCESNAMKFNADVLPNSVPYKDSSTYQEAIHHQVPNCQTIQSPCNSCSSTCMKNIQSQINCCPAVSGWSPHHCGVQQPSIIIQSPMPYVYPGMQPIMPNWHYPPMDPSNTHMPLNMTTYPNGIMPWPYNKSYWQQYIRGDNETISQFSSSSSSTLTSSSTSPLSSSSYSISDSSDTSSKSEYSTNSEISS